MTAAQPRAQASCEACGESVDAMTDETDTTSEVARVLGEHYPDQTSHDAGDLHGCTCGWEVPQPRSSDTGDWEAYWAHQAAMLAEAGLLDDAARPEGIERWEVALALTPYMDMQTRYRATADVWSLITRKPLADQAQIATQAPAEQPHAPSGGNGTGGGLGGRLRSAADYQDRPGAYDELRAMADEADRLERQLTAIRAAIEREAGHGDAITRCNLVAERFRTVLDSVANEEGS